VKNNLTVINVYKKRTLKSEVVTQLLYGDTFKKLRRIGKWIKIKNDTDNYKGYIKYKNFPQNQKSTHKVCDVCARLYSKPKNRSIIKKKLSFGSKVKVSDKKDGFYKFDNLWIKKKDLKKMNYKTLNPFNNIKKFANIKYRWGGKHFSGLDCSALIQLFLNYNGKFCPRDAKDQIKYFKKKVKLNNIKKNDLIFWKGHVAIVLSKKTLIHAYGPFKKVVIMSIKETINGIFATAKLRVIGIRRI